MIRPPRRPTLFPYTTLFHSGTAAAAALDQIDRPTAAEGEYDRHLALLTELEREARSGRVPKDELLARRAAVLDQDRKSTRLNSSHANISYAVFCLKKKNKNQ